MPDDYQKFSTFVGGIVDRKIRAISMGVTTSTGYFKSLIAQALVYSNTAQAGATASAGSASAADVSATSATIVYNTFLKTYLGLLTADPQRTSNGNVPNPGAFYIRSSDKHLRVAVNIDGSNVVTWTDAAVAADASSIVSAGAGIFLNLQTNTGSPQVVQGKVTFQGILAVPLVSDWTSQQPATALDVQNKINATNTSITNEVTRATAAETANANAIALENTRARGVESTLTGSIATETTRAQGAESTISTGLSTEVTRAKGVETNLQNALSTETTRATGAESTIAGNLTSEVNRALAAEGTINTALTTEVSRARAAEGTISTAVSTETTRATNSENSLQSQITTEVNRAKGIENGLQSQVTSEVNRAVAAEASLSTRITNTYTDFPNDYIGRDNSVRTDMTNYTNSQIAALNTNLANYTNAVVAGEASRATSAENSISSTLNNFTSQFQANSNGNGYYERRANGVIEQWGLIGAVNGEGQYGITFPIPFGNPNSIVITTTGWNSSSINNRDIWPQIVSVSTGGCVLFLQWTGGGGTSQQLDGVFWRAVGFNYTPSGGDPTAAGTTYTSSGDGGGVIFPGDGDGTGCIAVTSFLPNGGIADNAKIGDDVLLLNYDDSGYFHSTIEGIRKEIQPCLRITTQSGITLVASTTTPITTHNGVTLNILDSLGTEVPVLDNGVFRWEPITSLVDVGDRMVALISADNGTYAAAEHDDGRFIFTHNVKVKG